MNSGRFRTPNPPVYRTSTVLFENTEHLGRVWDGMGARDPDWTMYGTFGTPTTDALAREVLAREGGAGVAFAPSGLGAVTLSLLSVLTSGQHLLVPDSVYGPTREFCDKVLPGLGISTDYYDPLIGAGIAGLLRPNTAAVFMESPGSYTFEVQDVPAIVAAARANGGKIVTIMDNAWGSPGLFAPFAHGVDISVVPLTKYWGGHADLLVGAVVANADLWPRVRSMQHALGTCTNGDESYLALRGARSVETRMRAHEAAGLAVARWLDAHDRAGRVLHPALPSCPGHELWKRDFTGSNGLFSFELLTHDGGPAPVAEGARFVDALLARGHFGLGYSWGGYESLVMPAALPQAPNISRSIRHWDGGALIRLHIGLEPVAELLEDLQAAFDAS